MSRTPEQLREAAKRALEDAKEGYNRRKGELVAAVKTVREYGFDLPEILRGALVRYEHAERSLEDARDRAAETRRAVLTDGDKEASRDFQRISALIASHVVGVKLVKDPAEIHPWRIVEPGGRLRAVPHYAGELASISTAERLLTVEQQERYGRYLADVFACDFHRIATANPYARATAILHAIGVDYRDEPPATLAQ